MDKKNFEHLQGKYVKLTLKPNNFRLDGTIDALFDDCFQFTTKQQTGYIEYEQVAQVTWTEGC
ncbi:MAG: hypothetical protein ACFFD2_26835 [Promethearchaeota archaeon]